MTNLSTDTAPQTLGALLDARLGEDASIPLDDLPAAILNGTREVSLDPGQIDDPLGSDRVEGWQTAAPFLALKDSIAENGQDVPIRIWPADPSWRPDTRNPLALGGVRFHMLSGRRRTAACAALGKPVRAVIAARPQAGSDDETRFEMLCLRFRENDAREDLGPFERLLAIGELFEARLAIEGDALNASGFARRIGVPKGLVSRSRKVLRHRAAIEAACEAPARLTHRALSAIIARIEGCEAAPAKVALKGQANFNSRTIRSALRGTTLTVIAPNVQMDQGGLQGVTRQIAMVIPKRRDEPSGE